MGLLTATVALPIIGAIALAFVDPEDHRTIRFVALVFAAATFVTSILMVTRFDLDQTGFQLMERASWIPSIGASFQLGVDGISLVLVVLTTFLTPLIFLASWRVESRVKGYFASFLVLEGAVLGAFLALDLLLFYVFFDVMLVPMYLIIGIWGSANRRYAAVKFFLYTLLGGLLMLVAILFLFSEAGTFDYLVVNQLELAETTQKWLFVAFFVAFAVKLPLFPVHTWLPDAHTEAPTGGSVFLAAILLKIGGYGVLRFLLPLFPDATVDFAPWIIGLSVVGILYGAVVALMQPDVKRLIAYSSVSHMGFVMLGIFALTLTSASAGVVQMINHGLSTGALFLLVGFLYDRRHTRAIAAYGGLAKVVPVLAGFWLVVSLSSLALPGLNGFVGEFPILLGAYQSTPWGAVLGAFGAVLAALYLLWAYQRMFHGPVKGPDNQHTADLHPREVWVLVPIVALIVAIGIYPDPLYRTVEPSVDRIMQEAGLSGVEAARTEGVSAVTTDEGAGR